MSRSSGSGDPEMTESFTSVEWWELRGRGWVANILGVPGLDPRPFVGQQVEIDGKAYVAKGVETYRVIDPTGMDFGILVGER